ncbi:MAG: minor curlin subunit [Glaciecola sp.]
MTRYIKTNLTLSKLKPDVIKTSLFVSLLFLLVLPSQHGIAQDLGLNSDLQDSALSLSLSTTVDFGSALGGSITIGQFGLYNTTNIIQAGSNSNIIDITQQGNNNRAEVNQLGIGNSVVLLQQGENNLFNIIQDGNDNTANVNQFGEQTFIVTQIGNEMVVNVTQYNN